MKSTDDQLAQVIWDYHLLHHQLKNADCILVLGSHDPRVADRGVDLYEQGFAPLIMFSGGLGRLTLGVFEKSEAELFADIARKRGVPENAIIIENKSKHTGENIEFSRKMLNDRGLKVQSLILVQKPYMERRTFAAFKKFWPEVEINVTSPQLTFHEYVSKDIPKELVISIMVGDLQRVKLYPDLGFQIYQEIPEKVWAAYEELVSRGYNQHLVES